MFESSAWEKKSCFRSFREVITYLLCHNNNTYYILLIYFGLLRLQTFLSGFVEANQKRSH